MATITEAPKRAETIGCLPSLVNLLAATAEQKEQLKKQVERSGGFLNILVHPFYNLGSPDGINLPTRSYLNNVYRLIEDCLKKDLPLVIFEETRNFSKLPLRLNLCPSGKIFVVPTLDGEATPDFNQQPSFKPSVNGKEWQPLIKIFKEAGAGSVLVGGRRLETTGIKDRSAEDYRSWLASLACKLKQKRLVKNGAVKGSLLYGCVATVIYRLLPHFDVGISPVTSPHNINYRKTYEKYSLK